jgi:hypothetical protein
MQLLVGKTENFSVKDVSMLEDFLTKKMGFTGVESRPVNGDWVISVSGREDVVAKQRKAKESTPSDPADVD